jgi:mannosyltransferase OCH1-like enzyme
VIPKLIHQTAKTPEIPPACRPFVEKLRALHPGWTYRLWTDEDNLELVRTRMPEFLEVYQKLPKNIMRADVIRYVMMYVLGGLYLDTDYEFIRPFDLLDHDVVLPLESDGTGTGNNASVRVANAIFAAVPGHPFWKMVLDDLMANPPLGSDVNILSATGPLFLTRLYQRARDAGMKIHTPAPILFARMPPRTKMEHRAILRGTESYGIHHCFGSWREYSLVDKMKVGFWRAVRTII